jgi:hypothetical protein
LHNVEPLDSGEQFAGAIWVTDGALRADILSAEFGARALGVTSLDCLWEETVRAISDYNKVIIAIKKSSTRRGFVVRHEDVGLNHS